MRNGCNVSDQCYIQTCSLQSADCSFTSATGTFNENFDCFQTVVGSSFRSCVCCHLCSIRSRFSGASEAQLTCGCPGQSITYCVSDCNDCIVKSRLNVSLTTFYFSFVTASASCSFFTVFLAISSNLLHEINYFFLFATVFLGPFLVLAFVFVF